MLLSRQDLGGYRAVGSETAVERDGRVGEDLNHGCGFIRYRQKKSFDDLFQSLESVKATVAGDGVSRSVSRRAEANGSVGELTLSSVTVYAQWKDFSRNRESSLAISSE